MDLGLKERIAIVAASSRGLGKACALELAREGATVVICARDPQRLEAVAEQIGAATSSEVVPVPTDLADPQQIRHLAEEALRRFGRIDVLVTNNGGPPAGYFDGFGDEAWLAAHQLTLLSVVRLIRAVLPTMRAQRWGRIVNITSVSVKQPTDNLLMSNVYRPGVVALAKTLSTQKILAEHADSIPMGRMGEPEELAALVAFLASDRAGYITGTTIQVDGGDVRSVM
jgi:3-oxoacyl-[acyl-carrier protein] reductase